MGQNFTWAVIVERDEMMTSAVLAPEPPGIIKLKHGQFNKKSEPYSNISYLFIFF